MPEASRSVVTGLATTRTVPRHVVTVVGAGIVLALAFAFWHRPNAPPPTTAGLPRTAAAATPAPTRSLYVTVHVSGAVSSPGLVAVPEGGRVADALAAAGGVRPGGQLGDMNLAAPLTDGMHIPVPWIGDSPAGGAGYQTGRPSDLPVDVNRADVDRLTDLPGVGQVLANRIFAYRETHGLFAVLEDLLDVPGIGEGKLAGLRDYAVVGR